ncbi:MAG TPA: hypothetical protein PKA00_12130 [Saprospiraceae bacterium]|nr:hypothetical protein [Saprospiraceae bacterium]HMQ83654.1 hypothetical protein [Saprospiraceae bacterium]
MAKQKEAAQSIVARYMITGQVSLEKATDECATPPDLKAYAYDVSNELIGSGRIDEKGSFTFPVKLKQIQDVTVSIGPDTSEEVISRVQTFTRRYSAKDWRVSEAGNILTANTQIAAAIWLPWWPKYICVSGKIQKKLEEDGITKYCPVPYVKVEIFDVDREFCLWPWLIESLKVTDVLPPILRVPELPQPPIPDPGPLAFLNNPIQPISLIDQPRSISSIQAQEQLLLPKAENLTLSSKIAPWILWPGCFYSKRLICSTTTDCNGNYKCCFNWWPFHFKNGYFRYDSLPDIIIKVTQVIDGVERVVYLDPYTSTRWNSSSAVVNLTLDDDEVVCGNGCGGDQPQGTTTFFTRIGNDNVYEIDQGKGTFEQGVWSNVAYGGSLDVNAVFGDTLTNGLVKRYYKLSIRKVGSLGAFTDINVPLSDTRVHKGTLLSETYGLGPFTVNGVQNLYEIRDMGNYYWYNAQRIGSWLTEFPGAFPLLFVADEDKYILRLEVFDQNGVKLSSAQVDYRDGTANPGGVLPAMADRCDLILQIDNKAPVLDIQVPAAAGECGVVKHADVPFNIHSTINQENGRLYWWHLSYYKGLTGGGGTLASGYDYTGLLVPVNSVVSSAPMTAGLTSTCAFSLLLQAWPLVRNGYGLIHHSQINRAVAVEKCNC